MVLRIGQRIGNYRIIDEIAQGAYANVYKAVYNAPHKTIVALKILYKAFIDPTADGDVLSQEAHLLEQLKHPHILALIDFGSYENYPYIVKEYAPNGSLRERMRGRQMALNDVLYLLRGIGAGLQFAHDHKIVHCDLKPENILFSAQNEPLISDFDIARVLKTVRSFQKGIGGTPSYMSPEHFNGKVRFESDQYSLACMVYEMVTGQRPFEGNTVETLKEHHLHDQPGAPSQLRPDLPPHIEQAILQAMDKKYANRFASVADFVNAIIIYPNALQAPAWAEALPQNSGHKLILREHVRGRKAPVDDDIFYEETISMNAEATLVDLTSPPKPARRRAAKSATTAAKPAVGAASTSAKTARPKASVKAGPTAASTKPAVKAATSKVKAAAAKIPLEKKTPALPKAPKAPKAPTDASVARKPRTTKAKSVTPASTPRKANKQAVDVPADSFARKSTSKASMP
ncbi:serine/threonine protein kinase [Dictyobacter arantiisoli]|uniref:Protein kinase domain-containing protein n=1 Tax=Dictyobacter arantiisoli TaxID=2014874 RepID=A0A5A5TIS0_9CHLR|nr:serine/threonine-protein kinase [Dictyobacter arantiisoli]GCF11500.1 hypothetical protein KDI_50640 [Dictyobacter arantiisoli]